MQEGTGVRPQKDFLLREAARGLGVLGLLLVMMFWLAGVFLERVEPGPPEAAPSEMPRVTQRVERRIFPAIVDATGTVRAHVQAQVASRLMAQVREVLVAEGDLVEGGENGQAAADPAAWKGAGARGTLLARLDDSEIHARVKQAESAVAAADRATRAARARLEAARAQADVSGASQTKAASDYRRFEDLFKNRAATGQQLEHARAAKDMASGQLTAARGEAEAARQELERIGWQREEAGAALTEARSMLGFTRIVAPFTGRVVKKLVDVGDMAKPGQPLFLVETDARPELHASVSESLLPHLQPVGREMEVHVDALNRTLTGRLIEVSPTSDPTTRTVRVKVELLADPQLVDGLFGRLRVPAGEEASLVVPVRAVREVGQLHLVDVAVADAAAGTGGKRVQRRFVTLGRLRGEFVEIVSGLREGEEVVLP